MAANFKDALKQRRTYYALSNKSLISDQEIEDIISHVLLHTPSPLILVLHVLFFYWARTIKTMADNKRCSKKDRSGRIFCCNRIED
jgi:cytochrome c oxidase assembly factor CtaG